MWCDAVSRFLLYLHDTGIGRSGHAHPNLATIRCYERTLRSVMLDKCTWTDREKRKAFFRVVVNSKLTSPACLVLVNFLGPEFTAPRMTREYLEAWELDVVLLLLRADPKLTSLAVRGMAGLHSLSGKRPCSSFAEAKKARGILDALKKDGTSRIEEKLCECARVQ
jgi:hypothetical protein